MKLNSSQKAVLAVSAGAIAAMMLYPPLQFKGFGRGFGWLFAMDEGLTVNAAQLMVQWVAVCLVGAIAFVLAGARQVASTPGATSTIEASGGFGRRLLLAYRASRAWMWILLAMAGVALLGSSDPHAAALQSVGKLGAAVLIYTAVFFWHFARPSSAKGSGPARRTNWVRVAVYVVLAALAMMAVLAWTKRQTDALSGPHHEMRQGNQTNPFDQLDPSAQASQSANSQR